MRPLAGSDHRLRCPVIHAPERVAKHAGSIDNYLRVELEFLARFQIASNYLPFADRRHRKVIYNNCAMIPGGSRERDCQPRIIELPIEILDAAAQVVRPQRRQPFEYLATSEVAGAGLPTEQAIKLQPDAVIRTFPPRVGRQDKRNQFNQFGCIFEQQRALAQALADELQVSLFEVTHAPVNELGTAARSALREIALFEQHRAVAAARRVNRATQASRTAADNNDVPARGTVRQRRDHAGSIHGQVAGTNRCANTATANNAPKRTATCGVAAPTASRSTRTIPASRPVTVRPRFFSGAQYV